MNNSVLSVSNKKDFNKSYRNYKKKNMKKEFMLMDLFHFVYVGKADIYLSYNSRKQKFLMIVTGVHIVQDIFCFTPNYHCQHEFDSLYQAIKGFNKVVGILIDSMDWYDPEIFDSDLVYDEITIGVQ